MIGPLPPPIGGVANFVTNIKANFSSNIKYNIKVFRTGEMGSSKSPLISLLHDAKQSLKFVIFFKESNIDIIHVHTSSYYSFLRNVPYILWTRHFTDALLVLHIHGGMFKEFYNEAIFPLKYIVRRILRSADAVIVTSPSWIDIIKEISGKENGIYPLANGFEPAIFHPMKKQEARRELGLPDKEKILLSIGVLEKVKGHRFLIEALPEVNRNYGDVSLFIIGSGSLKEMLVGRVKELKLQGKVNFIEGDQNPEKIALWINSSDLIVLPSLNEGNPTVLFESLGCGRPFLGTRVGGVADVITSEEFGALCDPADSSGLSTAIVTMLGKEWNADRIAIHAQRYSWNVIASSLIEIYDHIIHEESKK
jgi:glycosyltransferase involved in cell wall biosynthesis